MEADWSDHLSKSSLFEKFKIQTRKDFELCGLLTDAPMIVSNQLTHIQEAFLIAIRTIENRSQHQLQQLLYRIDITEEQLKKMAREYPNIPRNDGLVELMIKRLLQKVVLKELHSS